MRAHGFAMLAAAVMAGEGAIHYIPSAHGIPWHPRRNQRQRRKQHRQTRPHGWKGGGQ